MILNISHRIKSNKDTLPGYFVESWMKYHTTHSKLPSKVLWERL